jgi:hypothetical protein
LAWFKAWVSDWLCLIKTTMLLILICFLKVKVKMKYFLFWKELKKIKLNFGCITCKSIILSRFDGLILTIFIFKTRLELNLDIFNNNYVHSFNFYHFIVYLGWRCGWIFFYKIYMESIYFLFLEMWFFKRYCLYFK